MSDSRNFQRGLNTELFSALQKNKQLVQLAKEKDHFMGIRNDYFNIYYKGLNIGKFYCVDQQWRVDVSQKYLSASSQANKDHIQTLILEDYLKYYQTGALHRKVQDYMKNERVCQQRLINNNNANPDSKYYCVDMEYVMQRKSSQGKNYGRFDIIAVAKEPNEQGKYDVFLIELKLGTGAIGGVSDKFSKAYKDEHNINLNQYDYSLGSGFLGHVANYIGYLQELNRYEKLKEEIVDIIKQSKALGLIEVQYFKGLEVEKLALQPEIIFLTYIGKEEKKQVIETASRYLFDDIEGKSKYNVQKITGYDMRKKLSIGEQEYKFKFYFREGNGEETQCILNEDDQDVFV